MSFVRLAFCLIATLLIGATVPLSSADAQQTQRLRGEIASKSGNTIVVKTPEGKDVKVTLAEDFTVTHVTKMPLGDIKPGMFVGSGAMPDGEGGWKAEEVHVFPAGSRPGEGHRPWGADPAGTMTNADVSAVVAGAGKEEITLTVNGQNYRIAVPPETPVVKMERGNRDLVKPGAWIGVSNAVEKDGVLSAKSITVSEDRRFPVR
jgi:hypothetical protein